MRNARSSITKLKTSLKSTLPEDNDLFGYQGINRIMLIDSLTSSYSLLVELENHSEKFEVIFLKRKIAKYSKNAQRILNYGKIENNFDELISIIEKLKYRIREAYLLIVEDSIRNEEEILRYKNELEQLNELIIQYKNKATELVDKSTASDEMFERISATDKNVSGGTEKINQYLSESKINSSSINELFQKSDNWGKEINKAERKIYTSAKDINSLKQEFNVVKDDISSRLKIIDEIDEEIKNKFEISKKQQDEIKETIGNANRSSMAGSFKTRKDELDKPLKNAELTMTISLVIVALASLVIIFPSIMGGMNSFDYKSFLIKLPVLFPLYWIAWNASRKFAHLSRIREDYAYKYAAAMAYEGYNKQTTNYEELRKKLLKLSIDTMGSNPIRLYNSKNVHSTPINEAISNAKDLAEKIVPKKNGEQEKSESESIVEE